MVSPTVETQVSLREMNSFGLPATARRLVRIASEADVRRVLDDPAIGRLLRMVIGGGSNLVFARDPAGVVLKVEVAGRRLLETCDDAFLVEHAQVGRILAEALAEAADEDATPAAAPGAAAEPEPETPEVHAWAT